MPTKTSHAEMLAGAARAFRRRGYHDTRVSDIAADVGVAQGTFYRYFASKEQAYLEVVTRLVERLGALASQVDVAAMDSIEDFREQFTAVYAAAFEVVAEDRDAAALLIGGSDRVSPDVAAIARAFVDELEDITARFIRRGVSRGFLRDLDVAVVARGVVGLLLHTVDRSIIQEGRSDALDALAETLVGFELFGAVARRTATAPS